MKTSSGTRTSPPLQIGRSFRAQLQRSPIRSGDELRLSVQFFIFLFQIGYHDPIILVSPVTFALSRIQYIIVMFAPCVALVCH